MYMGNGGATTIQHHAQDEVFHTLPRAAGWNPWLAWLQLVGASIPLLVKLFELYSGFSIEIHEFCSHTGPTLLTDPAKSHGDVWLANGQTNQSIWNMVLPLAGFARDGSVGRTTRVWSCGLMPVIFSYCCIVSNIFSNWVLGWGVSTKSSPESIASELPASE